MVHNCKGNNTVTAKVDGETREALDRDADRMGDFRADRIRDAISLYVELRRGEFECPTCGNSIQINP
jgi:predicted transcriptional regulator